MSKKEEELDVCRVEDLINDLDVQIFDTSDIKEFNKDDVAEFDVSDIKIFTLNEKF